MHETLIGDPYETIAVLAGLSDQALHSPLRAGGVTPHFLLYAALRREQAAVVNLANTMPGEASRILAQAQSAYRDLEALLAGRRSEVLEELRDGEWSLRDLLRHAIATELRYRAQIRYSADRSEAEPIAIPPERLPCDRLSPPDPAYAASRDGDLRAVLGLLGAAREATDVALTDLGVAMLGRPSMWGQLHVDVRERLHQMGAHLVEVTLQCEKMLTSSLGETTEARRIVRRVWAERGRHEHGSRGSVLEWLDGELVPIARAVAR